VLARLVTYVRTKLGQETDKEFTPVAQWFVRRNIWLGDKVAGVDFLSRMKQPLVPMEHELLRAAAQMSIEDRARLAEVAMRRNDVPAATALMTSVWNATHVEGRVATIADSEGHWFYFSSDIRPLARVLTATLAVRPDHELVGPLVEALVQRGRLVEERNYWWDTQDYAYAITGLSAFDRIRKSQGSRSVVLVPRSGRPLMTATVNAATRDSILPLAGLLTKTPTGNALRLNLRASGGVESTPVYYYLTVNEIPATQPVNVEEHGIRVERWYERAEGANAGRPVTSVTEGDVVRVRLRITVPATRNFVVVDDALPAGLEAIDLSLRTAAPVAGPGVSGGGNIEGEGEGEGGGEDESEGGDYAWGFGMWDAGWWSPFDHRELRDDRVVYFARVLWPGSYEASYIARATTSGNFVRPPAHAEEMYNQSLGGRSDGGVFRILRK